ncbi:MAG: SDR family NAD(P)-dependent oxidoreductase [Hyphomonadaceae bacterium]|nr:SDR family NAD(P)-dependent oxidoreductase [Hyphomonadaceae bacterium]
MSATTLASFPDGYRTCVFGATGGIGRAFVERIAGDPRAGAVHAGARRAFDPPEGAAAFAFDLESEDSIAAACARVAADGPLHLVVVATGVLHDGAALSPEKTWRAQSPEAFARAFAINTTGPALIAKHMLGHLAKGEKAVFAALSARVGSISDNRLGGWHAYRASKAALNMLIRTFAIELAQRNRTACAAALHPGTVDTALSQPFQSGVRAERLFTPQQSAGHLLDVIDTLTPAQSGKLFAWDGAEVPF